MAVPEFKSVTIDLHKETKPVSFKVIRKEDGSAVEGARIDIIWDGVMYKSLKSDPSGMAKTDFVPDDYYIVAQATDLGSFESSFELMGNGQELIIELGPKGTITSKEEDTVIVMAEESLAVAEPVTAEQPVETPQEEPEKPVEKKYENPNFSDDEFVANNIVFLIDVSISMKQNGRMELLKASMIELANLLRSRDKLAIVTYSSRADLALKSTAVSNKAEIIEVIKSLEPKGSTSGERGIKKAYQVLEANKIEGGNNQIFISTDGAFNLEKQDKALLEMVKKNASKGYKISVIGIRNSLGTVKNMKRIAEEGNGNYLHINNYNSARSTLVEEIKFQSRNNH
jgi:Mg-chelatase subunit ChlD